MIVHIRISSFSRRNIYVIQMHFGHDIYHNRTDKRKLTQQQVADAVFISLREYQKIEKGEISPGSEIFLRLVFSSILIFRPIEKTYRNIRLVSYRKRP